MKILPILAVALLVSAPSLGQTISWSGSDITGAEVKIPVNRPSVVVFARAEQDQSKEALTRVKAAVADPASVQVVVVVSGPLAAAQAKAMSTDLGRPWPVIADPDFVLSGKMNVHVWPTTLVVKSDGTQEAHLAGMPASFAADLSAHLDSVLGKIDAAGLERRLTTRQIVSDSAPQAAARHLQVAQRLLDQGTAEEAQAEIARGLELAPSDPMLLLASAQVNVLLKKPQSAIEILDKLPADALPTWQTSAVRARALMALEKWDDARKILPDAIKLNPRPAEAHYLLGLCFQHDKDSAQAAEQFKLAYEKLSAVQQR